MKQATGQQLIDLLNKHIGEPYVMGTLVPKDDPNYDGFWDCAEFISWGIFQISGILYGCLKDTAAARSADAYTGYWDRDAHALGKIITVEEAARTPGAAVLRVAATGEVGHIVASDGHGGTVEAHGHADGVVNLKLTNRRWDYGILVPGVAYTTLPPIAVTPPAAKIYRLTHPYMVSNVVGTIQKTLNSLGFPCGVADNIFGLGTMKAVQAFQKSKGLIPDGEVGPETLRNLNL